MCQVCVCHIWVTTEGRAPLALSPAANVTLQTHLRAQSSVSYRQHMGKVGHLQIQVKADCFVVKEGHRVKSLKPFLMPNPSLSRSKEKTTLFLKERSGCFPTALRVKGLTHLTDTRNWFNYHLPTAIQNLPLTEKCH